MKSRVRIFVILATLLCAPPLVLGQYQYRQYTVGDGISWLVTKSDSMISLLRSIADSTGAVSIGTLNVDSIGIDLTTTDSTLAVIDSRLAPGDTITTRLNQIGHWTRLTQAAVVTGNASLLDLETLLGAIEPDVDTLVTRATLANSRLNLLNTRMYQTRDNVAAVRDTLTTSNVWLERVRDAVNAISMSVNVDSLEIDFTATNAILSDSLTPTLTNELLRAIRDSLGTLDLGDISMSAAEGKLDSLMMLGGGTENPREWFGTTEWTVLAPDGGPYNIEPGDTLVVAVWIKPFNEVWFKFNASTLDTLDIYMASATDSTLETGCPTWFNRCFGCQVIEGWTISGITTGNTLFWQGHMIPASNSVGQWIRGTYAHLWLINPSVTTIEDLVIDMVTR